MKIDLTLADLSKFSWTDRESIYRACEAFSQTEWFELFFRHLKNLYVSSILWLNEINRRDWATPITDDTFNWGLEMMSFIYTTIQEYSQAKEMRKPNKVQE
jgi:hypothetical protein